MWESKSYYLKMRPKRKQPNCFSKKSVFGLKQVGGEEYWDGKAPPLPNPGWRNNPAEQTPWKPKFTSKPVFWYDKEDAIKAYHEYELYNTATDGSFPDLELVTHEIRPEPVSTDDLTICPIRKEHDRILRHHGLTLAQAYEKLDNEKLKEDPLFAYAIKRKGKSKELIDSAELDNAVSSGVYTFVRSEADALHVRLLIGENFDRMWRLS